MQEIAEPLGVIHQKSREGIDRNKGPLFNRPLPFALGEVVFLVGKRFDKKGLGTRQQRVPALVAVPLGTKLRRWYYGVPELSTTQHESVMRG